jgi:hypothetical protein
MSYDKLMVSENGEEHPYSESLENGRYQYFISVMWDDKDGELVVINTGAHIEFDIDGSWLVFKVPPESLFPKAVKLSELELLRYMSVLEENIPSATSHSKEEMDSKYQQFLKSKKL